MKTERKYNIKELGEIFRTGGRFENEANRFISHLRGMSSSMYGYKVYNMENNEEGCARSAEELGAHAECAGKGWSGLEAYSRRPLYREIVKERLGELKEMAVEEFPVVLGVPPDWFDNMVKRVYKLPFNGAGED